MDREVVILPSFAQVEDWRKRHARSSSAGLFGQVVTTFDAWVADLWELHGDGRAIIDGARREVAMHALFQGAGNDLSAPGFAPMAAECMRKAAGVVQFERALDEVRRGGCPELVSAREREVLILLAEYEEAIRSLGFIEFGQAATLIAGKAAKVFPQQVHVLMPHAVPMDWVQRSFFDSSPQLEVEFCPAPGEQGVPRAPEGVDVRFSFPSGRLAQPGAIADAIRLHGDGAAGDVIVVCKDPLSLYEQLESPLIGKGFNMCVQASKPFAGTEFGRAFLALYHCLHDEPWDPALLSDVLLSSFSGFSRGDALRIDRDLRGNRLAEREESLTQLYALSDSFSRLGELASDPDADVLIGSLEQMARSSGRSSAWQSEQLAAMSVLRGVTAAARAVRADMGVCAAILERASLPVSAQARVDGPSVVITSQSAAARKGAESCSMLVVSDLTAEDYPVSDREDAMSTLLAKLGLPPEESSLSRARREFCALLALPTDLIVLVRPLGDANADDTYPSVVLEEFVDSYRGDSSDVDDVDNPYRLPLWLRQDLSERGEELLFANAKALAGDAAQPMAAEIPWPQLDDLNAAGLQSALLPRRNGQGHVLEGSCASPSQIEAYLECPYRWFATRRMKLEGLDEGFGAAERGTFAHTALERFYRTFQQSGHMKVDSGNLASAREIMRGVLDGLVHEQPFIDPQNASRFVAVDELERREVQALCDQLVGYLDFEAQLLPTFHPAHLEYKLDACSGVKYAGFPLVGVVDRIDVDGEGHAVIVDYKGSVSEEHEIGGKTARHAGKVQTRIYARAVERALGLSVVAALYVSYGRRPAVAGAYDPHVVEAAHLPGMRYDYGSCGVLSEFPDPLPDDFPLADLAFDGMLDATESLAGAAITDMGAGKIAPASASSTVCEHCPVLACEKRGA